MTALESMAKAMADRMYELEQQPDAPDCYRRLGMGEYADLARAALTAIREPSDGMMGARTSQSDEPWWYEDALERDFTAMIEHALNGGS